jgi:HAD superfamily hydrolase (TIGR01509 family)
MTETERRRGLRAVILDIDGTLLDSNDAHAEAWKEVGLEFGKNIPFHAARALIGMGGDKVLPRLTGFKEDDPRGKEILDRRGEIFRERYLPRLQPLPGARDLLTRLKHEGLQLVVATSADEEEVALLLERAGVRDLIEDTASSGDVDESKPAPDIVDAALERAGCLPNQTVMMGDTPYDVLAAQRAGVAIIGVRSGGWGDRDLAGSIEIYDHPLHLLKNFDSSVLAGRPVMETLLSPSVPQRYGRRPSDSAI